jgi:A/G-specific adenine glycosylase
MTNRRAEALLPEAAWLSEFRRKLRAWYGRNARKLPWRGTRDPYAVWLSEIMLQQTQVATVKPYFDRFLQALPTIEALAQADEQLVLRLWEGLGYYRRARQLHEAAKIVAEQHGGRFPRDVEAVRRLPGIGRYTAGAILSIAFDARQPILEANTVRLFSRLLAYGGDPASSAGQRLLWAMAAAVLPQRQPGQLNQALMELGSQVCQSRAPRCQTCPVESLCRARAQGIETRLPGVKQKPPREEVREAAALVRRSGRVLLVQWQDGHRWAGLWDFPRFPVQGEHPLQIHRELIDHVRHLTGITIRPGACLKTLRHGVTRFHITLQCYEAEYVAGPNGRRSGGRSSVPIKWLQREELRDYPLSSTGRKLAKLV